MNEEQPAGVQRKRSKRHRQHRNNISDKARVESVKDFAFWAQGVERRYRARYPKTEKQYFQ